MGRRTRDWLGRLALGRPEARAWALYDWANSAVYTTVVGALFPVYFTRVVAAHLPQGEAERDFTWTTVGVGLAVALTAPFLGALADVRAAKKRMLGLSLALGAAACAGLFAVDAGDVVLGLLLFALTSVGAAASLVFYDALLPHVAGPGEVDRLSATGFGLGYLGGGLLLLAQLVWVRSPEAFGLPPDSTLPVRLAFVSVAVWWAVFSLPLLRRVPEPPATVVPGDARGAWPRALGRVRGTLGELRRYRQAWRMLLAFLVYNDGIMTVVKMAAIYAGMKGFGVDVVLGTFLLVQFVGFPAALLFGRLADRFGPKRAIVAGLCVYVGTCFFALAMDAPRDFYVLGALVGTVQGGCQALGRSLFARFVPRHRSGEFFALLAVGEKFASVLGPLAFGVALALLGDRPEPAILTLVPFFVVGAWLVSRVDVEEGRRAALAAEAEAAQRSVAAGAS